MAKDDETKNDLNGEKLRQETFAIAFTTIGSDTFSKAELSAKAAGFSESSARNAGTRLLRNPDVQKRICELHELNCGKHFITEGKILADLENDKLAARAKGDYASAIRASELGGKFITMFSEKFKIMNDGEQQPQISPEDRQVLEDASRQLAIRLAKSDCEQNQSQRKIQEA